MNRTCLLLLASAASVVAGCPATKLDGDIDGRDFSDVAEAVYFELRGTDVGTSLPFHDIALWLMPMTDACTVFPAALAAQDDLLQRLDAGMDANEFCEQWSAAWTDAVGEDDFWAIQFRLRALPRPEETTPATEYAWLDEDGTVLPDGPVFDAAFALYPAPSTAACAAIFNGDGPWEPALHEADGGGVVIREYDQDTGITGALAPTTAAGDDPLTGRFRAAFCPGSGDWPIDFALEI